MSIDKFNPMKGIQKLFTDDKKSDVTKVFQKTLQEGKVQVKGSEVKKELEGIKGSKQEKAEIKSLQSEIKVLLKQLGRAENEYEIDKEDIGNFDVKSELTKVKSDLQSKVETQKVHKEWRSELNNLSEEKVWEKRMEASSELLKASNAPTRITQFYNFRKSEITPGIDDALHTKRMNEGTRYPYDEMSKEESIQSTIKMRDEVRLGTHTRWNPDEMLGG